VWITGLTCIGKDGRLNGKASESEPLRTREILEYYGVPAPENAANRLKQYLSMLEKNRKWAKLTSGGFREGSEAALADSVAVGKAIGFDEKKSLADLGAGGGLLGLVLAICCAGCQVTLLESSTRKAAFLAEAIGALKVQNARVVNARAESLLGVERFDLVVSRAAGKLSEIAPVALGLLPARGRYIALKAPGIEPEIAEALPRIEAASGRLVSSDAVDTPPFLSARTRASLVLIEKL